MEFVTNAAGRKVPTVVNGRKVKPFAGIDKSKDVSRNATRPVRKKFDYPDPRHKVLPNLRAALEFCKIGNGQTVSTHHHLRDGDGVAKLLFDTIHDMKLKDIVWFPSATFACHDGLIKYFEDGTIHHLEASAKGDLGKWVTAGNMADRGLLVVRSHGGRYLAIQDGDMHIDVAVVAASSADSFGNANGLYGPGAFGHIGFAKGDIEYAEYVIVVTDNLVEFPMEGPWQVEGWQVDAVVNVDSIGDPSKIMSGTTKLPDEEIPLKIASLTARFCDEAGLIKNGFSFQGGASGMVLAATHAISKIMAKKGIKASFARGGSTKYLVEMLESGQIGKILDGQLFDAAAVESMRRNTRTHICTNPAVSYSPHGKGRLAEAVDIALLGAMEIDLEYNVNPLSYSTGIIAGAIGGFQNCLGGGCVIILAPARRKQNIIIRDQVTTIVAPGETVDVWISEQGIAINPKRKDLLDKVKGSSLPIKPIEQIQAEVKKELPDSPTNIPKLCDKPVGVVMWEDETVIDTLWQVPMKAE